MELTYQSLLEDFHRMLTMSEEGEVLANNSGMKPDNADYLKAVELAKRLYHTQRLGMEESYYATQNAVVAFMLERIGYTLVQIKDLYITEFSLEKINLDGTQNRINITGHTYTYWKEIAISDYNNNHGKPIATEYLSKLNAEMIAKAVVLYTSSTHTYPIVAFPITPKAKKVSYRRKYFFFGEKIKVLTPLENNNGRFFAVLWTKEPL